MFSLGVCGSVILIFSLVLFLLLLFNIFKANVGFRCFLFLRVVLGVFLGIMCCVL